ncbi:MAG: hypothetical protein QXD60_03255, partial [Nanopusillaceae archaeon]
MFFTKPIHGKYEQINLFIFLILLIFFNMKKFNNNSNNNFSLISKSIVIIIVLILTIGSIITLYLYFSSHDLYFSSHDLKIKSIIAAGSRHTCALLSNGSIMCWGYNWFGQLGDGTYEDRPTPVPVQGINNAIAIAAGYHHTCALLSNRSVMCWGRNGAGQL